MKHRFMFNPDLTSKHYIDVMLDLTETQYSDLTNFTMDYETGGIIIPCDPIPLNKGQVKRIQCHKRWQAITIPFPQVNGQYVALPQWLTAAHKPQI